MIVTRNEVEQWCLRAMTGAGAPAGVDEDAAGAAAWLAAHGFPAIDWLSAAVERWNDDRSATRLAKLPSEDGTDRFEADGRSAVFLSGLLIDSAVAAATTAPATTHVNVARLTDPLFLLPPAERHRQRGWIFELRWGQPGKVTGGARLGRDGPSLFGEIDDGETRAPQQVTIICSQDASVLGQEARLPPPPVSLTTEDLTARAAATLENGIPVADEAWAKLKAQGMRALVPASEESRLRGAGAQVSDSE